VRWSSLVLAALVACTSTQSDMVEPTIDPPGPIAWLEPPAPPLPLPSPGFEFLYQLKIARRVIAEAEAHQAVEASYRISRRSPWVDALSRAACRHFGCGPCIGELEFQRMHCSEARRRMPMEVTGCEPDEP